MDFVVFSSDGSVSVQKKEENTLGKIFGMTDGEENVYDMTVAEFTKQDIQQAHFDRVFIDYLGGNGFNLYVNVHIDSLLLYRRGVFQENKCLANRGCKGVYGPVVISAQIVGDDGFFERKFMPASIALPMAEHIFLSKDKPKGSIFSGVASNVIWGVAFDAKFDSSQKASEAMEAVAEAEAEAEAMVSKAKMRAEEAKVRAGAASEWLARVQHGNEGLLLAEKARAEAEEEEKAGEKADEVAAIARQKEKLARYFGSLSSAVYFKYQAEWDFEIRKVLRSKYTRNIGPMMWTVSTDDAWLDVFTEELALRVSFREEAGNGTFSTRVKKLFDREAVRPRVKHCAYCRQKRVGSKKCGLCRSVRYCGEACMTMHWVLSHKASCTRLIIV